MPLLGRRASEMAAEPARAPLSVLRADGQRIDLTSRESTAKLAATRQSWAATSWDYRNMIGELRFATKLLGTSVARARFYVAELRPHPDDPAELTGEHHGIDPQVAADAVANFDRLPFLTNPFGFTGRLVENLSITGEAFIHIDAKDRFHVRSTSELAATPDGKVTIKTNPGGGTGSGRVLDPAQEEVLRCWSADPEWGDLADSPMKAALDICEDAVLAGREERAAARSRLAANGILLVPAGLSMAMTRDGDDDGDDPADDTFMADLTEAFLAPVRDDGEPQAVVPIVLRGEPEDLEKVRHLTVQRADAESLLGRKNAAILRLLKSLDIQPEQVEGVGGTSHWNAWVIDARAIRDQITPMAELVAGCLTAAFLRPALLALGHDEDAVDRIAIVADTSGLAENPNRGQDARDAHAAFAISDSKLREALGFDDDDAPDDQEVMRRLATSGRLSVTDTAEILGVAKPGAPVTVDGQVTKPALPAVDEPRPVARPGEVQAEQPVPDTMPDPGAPAIVAAAEPELLLRCEPDLSRRLADIDAALTDRILVAADAALARVLERAGARVRSAAQKNRTPGVVASLRGLDAARIPAALGRERVATFVPVADLVTDEHTRLRGQVMGWLQAAAADTGRVVCALLDLDPNGDGRVVTQLVGARLLADLDGAWAVFAQALAEAAEEALFDETPDPTGSLMAAEDVDEFLAAAGGSAVVAAGRHRRARSRHELPAGADSGFATGPLIVRTVAEAGAVLIGREWSWRAELVRDGYEPHQDLDGLRFASWDDPELRTGPGTDWVGTHFRPGDHKGCLCRTAPLFAIPADPEVRARLREAAGDPRRIPAGIGARLRDRILAAVDSLRATLMTRRRQTR